MPIETTCQTCGQRLRVADEHAGKAARCPGCQTIYTVPQPGAIAQQPAAATSAQAGSERWHLKTPDGVTYGPVPKPTLDQWMQQGRITAQSQILSEGDGQWVWAGKLYPQLGSLSTDSPFQPAAGTINPYAPPPGTAGYSWSGSSYREQHRGPAILTLAIVGIFVCDIVSLIAVVMAIIDLNKMSSGAMDPAGRGLTIAGLVIAIIKWVLMAVVIGLIALNN